MKTGWHRRTPSIELAIKVFWFSLLTSPVRELPGPGRDKPRAPEVDLRLLWASLRALHDGPLGHGALHGQRGDCHHGGL